MVELDKKSLTFSQSNTLIEASYSMTSGEMHLIFSILSMIHKNDSDFKEYVVTIKNLSSLIGKPIKNIYTEIDDITNRLLSRVVYLKKDDGKFLKTAWISSAEYEAGLLTVQISPKLKPYLLNLKGRFKRFELVVLLMLKSSYSIRIYMLLKQYESLGVREFDLVEFKQILGLTSKMYQQYKYINKFVIKKAKKELDKKDKNGSFISDISFNFEPIKQGRSVARLRFVIYQNHKKAVQDAKLITPEIPALQPQTPTQEHSPQLTQLLDFGVAGAVAQQIVNKYPPEYIQEKLALTAEEDRKSPVGFFVKALEGDYKSKKVVKKRIQAEKKNIELDKKREAEKQDAIIELGKEYGRIERESYLNSLTDTARQELTQQVMGKCKKDNNQHALLFLKGDVPLEHNPHIRGYINEIIPDFEESQNRYIKDKLMEKGLL